MRDENQEYVFGNVTEITLYSAGNSEVALCNLWFKSGIMTGLKLLVGT